MSCIAVSETSCEYCPSPVATISMLSCSPSTDSNVSSRRLSNGNCSWPMRITTRQGSISAQNVTTSSAAASADTDTEPAAVIMPSSCGSSESRSGPIGNNAVAVGPDASACSAAGAMPTGSLGTITYPSNRPEATTSSIWLNWVSALNSPSKISVSTLPASSAACWTPS